MRPIKVSFIPVKGSHRFHIKNTNRHYADPLNPQIKLDQRLMVTMTMACHAERGPRQRERSAPHHRDRQVSPLGIGEEMRFVEDVASVAGLVPTGAGCRHPRVQGPLFGSSRRFRRYPAVKRPKSSTQLGDEHADRQMV